jgi:transcriptional regulator with XRE-family HTH domain
MRQPVREFLRAVRGDRSQVAFARRLRYRGNPIADWEAGRRCPTAAEALRACHLAGIDVVAAFARFQSVPLSGAPRAFELAAWLDQIRGSTSVAELARRAGLTRHRVARWLNGQTQPRLLDFFALVQAISGRLCDLVAELVPIERVPSLLADYQRRLAARRLAHEEPWTEAILRVLETTAYRESRHQRGMIAATLGIAFEVEQRCLQKLEHAGVIARGASHFEPVASLTVDTRAIPKLKAHWSEVAAARLSEPLAEDLFSYNVLSASHTDLARIRQLLLATYREIRTIVEHTERDEGIALINLQLVNWLPREST